MQCQGIFPWKVMKKSQSPLNSWNLHCLICNAKRASIGDRTAVWRAYDLLKHTICKFSNIQTFAIFNKRSVCTFQTPRSLLQFTCNDDTMTIFYWSLWATLKSGYKNFGPNPWFVVKRFTGSNYHHILVVHIVIIYTVFTVICSSFNLSDLSVCLIARPMRG